MVTLTAMISIPGAHREASRCSALARFSSSVSNRSMYTSCNVWEEQNCGHKGKLEKPNWRRKGELSKQNRGNRDKLEKQNCGHQGELEKQDCGHKDKLEKQNGKQEREQPP